MKQHNLFYSEIVVRLSQFIKVCCPNLVLGVRDPLVLLKNVGV